MASTFSVVESVAEPGGVIFTLIQPFDPVDTVSETKGKGPTPRSNRVFLLSFTISAHVQQLCLRR